MAIQTAPSLGELRETLAAVGQAHLLTYLDELPAAGRSALLEQIGSLPLRRLPALVDAYVKSEGAYEVPGDLEPAPYFPRDPRSAVKRWDAEAAREAGEALLRAGRVACFTVAGGQGTRLGFDGPKGCYPAGAASGKPLFQIFAEQVLATGLTFGARVPWYIMTSPLNHAATVAFFQRHAFFGLRSADVMFFQQGVMPSFDKATGRVLLAAKGEVATNPDGHGGAIGALHASGALADMRARGVEHISYFQVDNPCVKVADPVFLGLHAASAESSGEMSSKMLPKVDAKEKVGVFCRSRGRVCVIEYSDMPEALASQRHTDGTLRFIGGSIAIHALSVAFVEKVATDPGFELPYHRAVKKVPHVDLASGRAVEPAEPNGVKLERFVFDAVPMAERSIVLETDRVEEFAPIKNREGVDSVVTSKQLQTERAARWLAAAGVDVPRRPDGSPDCTLEISPLTALNERQLSRRVREGMTLPRIDRGAAVVL